MTHFIIGGPMLVAALPIAYRRQAVQLIDVHP